MNETVQIHLKPENYVRFIWSGPIQFVCPLLIVLRSMKFISLIIVTMGTCTRSMFWDFLT